MEVSLNECELCPGCQETLAKKKEKLSKIICQKCSKNEWRYNEQCSKCGEYVCHGCICKWTSGWIDNNKGIHYRDFKCKCTNIIKHQESWDGNWRD